MVCPLTRVVLCESMAHQRPFTVRKPRGGCEVRVTDVREAERASFRRVGDLLMSKLFAGGLPRPESYVNRALVVNEWLGERLPFDAVLFATLVYLAEGVDTPNVFAQRDDAVHERIPPIRNVAMYGIKQNSVTKACTAIMRRKNVGRNRLIM